MSQEITKQSADKTAFAFSQVNTELMELMKSRPLTEHECQMLEKRDRHWNWRKIIEKIIYMLPSIIYSISQMLP